MARYHAEMLQVEIPYSEAVNRLAGMSDDDVIARLQPEMFDHHGTITHQSWRPTEPEHETLIHDLRRQVQADLLTAYFGETDYTADAQLAHATTRPYPTLIYLSEFEQDPDDDPDAFGSSNPVVRLRALGICAHQVEAPTPLTNREIMDVLTQPNTATRRPVRRVTAVPSTTWATYTTTGSTTNSTAF